MGMYWGVGELFSGEAHKRKAEADNESSFISLQERL